LDAGANVINSLANLPFDSMVSLQTLDLSSNELTEVPDRIGQLPCIEKLFLHENHLTRLPNELGNLKKLTELNIDENKIQNLPPTVGGCEKLEVLNANQNRLVDLPKGIYDLPLRIFGIDDNPLEAIPAEVLEGGSQSVFDFLGARKY
jgi:Leucine-rich repeat (LRR) protein